MESESDGDVREGDEEKTMRMMKWKARRSELERRNSFLHVTPDATLNAASFDPTHPPPSDAAQANEAASRFTEASNQAKEASSMAGEARSQAEEAAYKADVANTASYAPFFDDAQTVDDTFNPN